MIRTSLSVIGAILLGSLAACSASSDPVSETNGSDIINGVDASGAEFNAIGGLVWVGADGTEALCTATLIAKNVVLTAKHCAMATPSQEGSADHLHDGKIYFLTGPDLQHPLQVVQAKSVALAEMYNGGFTGLGSDVSIFTLSSDITGIDPIAVATTGPTQADVGTQFIGIGYGIQDAAGTTGTRKMGNITLRSVTGAPAPMVWPNADAYLASIIAEIGPSTTLTDDQKNQIKSEYTAPMSDGYEVFVGGAAGDSQICHGDSGGPLLRKEANGKYMVHGVTSTTMDQTGSPPVCKSGGIYTTFGANTRDVIAKQIGEHCGLDAHAQFACGLAAAPATCTAPSLQPGATEAAPSALEACLQGSCCAEANDCFGDTSCNTLSTCFDSCTGDATAQQTCAQTCYDANPQAYVKYLGFAACSQTNCAAQQTSSTSSTSTAATTTTSAKISGLKVRIH